MTSMSQTVVIRCEDSSVGKDDVSAKFKYIAIKG